MPEPIVAPETEGREALIKAAEVEFAGLGFEFRSDKLHGSLGTQGTVIGCFPVKSQPWSRDQLVQDSELTLQFYGKYDLKVDPNQKVDPGIIEEYAERYRRKVQSGVDPRTASVWYFSLVRIVYPDDPTGNKTRFEATFLGRGNNSALLETS